MTEAERAYAAAEAAIAEAKASGADRLDLSGEAFNALERLPSEIGELTELRALNVSGTRVKDLSPLAGLGRLTALYLSRTRLTSLDHLAGLSGLTELYCAGVAVEDLSPVASLSGLTKLYIAGTVVRDLSPLVRLERLRRLEISRTDVNDLSPLRSLSQLAEASDFRGLRFSDTPATRADPELARIAAIKDNATRARVLFDWLDRRPALPAPIAEVPLQQPAPIEVAIEGGRVVRAAPVPLPEGPAADRARAGWEALREVQDDLAPHLDLPNLPHLGRAMAAFGRALGPRFEDVRPIALGTHGLRIVAIAREAGTLLREEQAAELSAYADAITLHLQRFPDWQAYLRDLPPDDGPALAAEATALREVAGALIEAEAIAPEVAKPFADLVEAAEDAVLAPTVAKAGVLGSLSNILAGAVSAASRGVAGVARDLAEESYKGAVKLGGGAVVTGTTAAAAGAFDALFNKAGILIHLSRTYPQWLGWVEGALKALGLP